MSDQIKVYVIDKGRKSLYLMYHDPLTGKRTEKSAGTSKHGEAVKAAGKWEAELREGRYQKPNRMTWEAFREYDSANALPGLAERTAETYESTLNVFESKCNPQRLADVTTARVTAFVTILRTENAAEATIAHHLRHLKAATRWAHRQGLLPVLPVFTMPKRAKAAKVMHGRPITTEEYERMLVVVPKAIEARPTTTGIDTVTPWRFYLTGLWASGLRLSESLTLRWDDAPDSILVDFTHKRPMLRIPAEAEKGNQDRLLPMTPEFAVLLQSIPEADRRGKVFKLPGTSGRPMQGARSAPGKTVAEIGKAAGVVVDQRTKGGKIVRKFASAHDLRRAFGQRWANRVMPNVLRELMRHEKVETTMKYYVGQNAEATADALWSVVDSLVDTTRQQTAPTQKTAGFKRRGRDSNPQPPDRQSGTLTN